MAEVRDPGVRVQAVVVGGGVVGCAVLRELAVRGIDAILLEAEADIGLGSSKANSAILHSGYDAKPGTVEARHLRRSRDLWPGLLEELGVPFLPVGALMVVRSDEERARLLHEIMPTAAGHGVDTEILAGDGLREVAPYLAPDALAALSIPAEGIVDPFWLTRAFAESAMAAGARVRMSAPVTAIDVDQRRVVVTVEGGDRYEADQAFDCGGLFADGVAALAGDTSFSIRPRKGQFLVSETTFGVDRIVLPVPGPMGKGMLLTPIVFGGVLLGPTAEDIDDKTDRSTDRATRERIIESCAGLVPDAREMTPIRQFAGLRSASSTGDYIIRPSTAGDRLHIVAGIRSTGISASCAIAEAVVDDVGSRRGWDRSRPARGPSPEEPEWGSVAGEVVCVCRSVGEAEVDAALRRPSPATTLDGLKRRCGVAFGDCQGNLCAMPLVERLAAARGVEPWAIEKDLRGSWIVAGAVATDIAVPWSPSDTGPGGDIDVAIIGGGAAGIGAALEARRSGQAVLVIDRGRRPGGTLLALGDGVRTPAERDALAEIEAAIDRGDVQWRAATTAIGLRMIAKGWAIEVQDADGSAEIAASQVVLATGGYVTPREHRTIDGPRSSGVLTADAALGALDRGWLPARRAVVVGAGRLAEAIAGRLDAAGASVAREEDGAAIDAICGVARLEGVRLAGAWHDADALILADRSSPATFLLRALGLVDEAPGVPAPVDANGRLQPGLWAAGTCVTGDVDHVTSLEDGRRVARAAISARVAVR